jgi:PERQ amino acid-rich with GYF domain-containing protein
LTSVNSPIKASTDQAGRPANRKISGNTAGNNAFASPGIARNTNRRRAPSESYPFPTSGENGGEEVSGNGSLLRRKTELKEDIPEHVTEVATPTGLNSSSGFGSIKRNPFGPLSAGLNGPASPWGSNTQAAASPMGAFSRGVGFGIAPGGSSTNRPGFGSTRGESRFRDLMKASVEDEPSSLRSKPSMGSFGVSEEPASRRQTPGFPDDGSDRPISRATQANSAFGSAALGGLHDESPDMRPAGQYQGGLQRGHEYDQGIGTGDGSPTYTNPYQSPPRQSNSIRDLAEDDDMNVLPGLGGFNKAQEGSGNFDIQPDRGQGSFPYDPRHFERADQGNRGFPGIPGLAGVGGGLGGLPGLGTSGPWSNTGLPLTTPGRERPPFADAFGDTNMRTPGAFGSPSVGTGNTFGGIGAFGYGGTGTIGRGSKLGSLYSGNTQDPMTNSREGDMFEQEDQLNGLGGVRRDADSPFRGARGKFDEFFSAVDQAGDKNGQPQTYSPASAMQTPSLHQPGVGQRAPSIDSSSSTNQLPTAQQKTMVMPDRARWVYKDPQGNTQGPWTGLEMHEWYRAGFFSPELLVKKAEDADYEPLAQLIRRIGNSREPFLVPQIGVPGPAAGPAAVAWLSQGQSGQQASSASAAQPPFAGSFPSFGTTLTADQQNALERRKQEEQYLMHQQKEHLAYQQSLQRQSQMQGQHGQGRQQLAHQQSMQSLHSQPSYGSMASPSTFQAHPVPGAYDSFSRAAGANSDNLGHIREEDTPGMYDASRQERYGQAPIGSQHSQEEASNDHRIATMLADRARLAHEQAEQDDSSHEAQPLTNERLDEFLELRRQEDNFQDGGKSRQGSGQKRGKQEVPIEKLVIPDSIHASLY